MPSRHLLRAEDEDGVVLPRTDGRRRQHERGSPAGAAGLHVDDGHARHAEAAEHLVARRDTAVGGATEGGLKVALADPRLAQRGAHGHYTHVGRRDAVETAERVQADTGHGDAGHAGAKAYVTTSLPSGSRCSGTIRSSIGWPATNEPGSLSVSRVMTRTPSGSSTTPTPKGTSPW